MDHQIRFLAARAGRIAYAAVGSGPPLVLPAWWLGHLERNWEHNPFRRFRAALAERHTVVHYDPLGPASPSDTAPGRRRRLALEAGILGR